MYLIYRLGMRTPRTGTPPPSILEMWREPREESRRRVFVLDSATFPGFLVGYTRHDHLRILACKIVGC